METLAEQETLIRLRHGHISPEEREKLELWKRQRQVARQQHIEVQSCVFYVHMSTCILRYLLHSCVLCVHRRAWNRSGRHERTVCRK